MDRLIPNQSIFIELTMIGVVVVVRRNEVLMELILINVC